MKTLAFRNGDQMPILGLGTWKSEAGQVYAALDQGYRFLDGGFWLVEGGPWTRQSLWDEASPAAG